MLLNVAMVAEAFEQCVTQRRLGGHEPLLCLKSWQMYNGEADLKPSVLYLSEAGRIRGEVCGPAESAMILLGDPSDCEGRLRCPCLFADSGKIDTVTLINEVEKAFEYFSDVDRSLCEALYEGESFQKLVDLISPVMSNEVILMNSDFQLVGQTYKRSRLYEQNSFVQDMGQEYIPSEVFTFFKNDPVYASVRDETEPFLYKASIHNVDIWCMNVFRNNRFLCRVTMPESERRFRPYDKELVRYFTGFVQKKYNDLRADDSYQRNSRLSGLLVDILEGKNVEDSRIADAMEDRETAKARMRRCVYIVPSDRDYYNKTLSAYCDYIEREFVGAVAFEYEQHIVCVIPENTDEKEKEKTERQFEVFLRDNYLRAGFSNRFTEIGKLAAFYRQAKAALSTGIKDSPHKWFFKFQEECLAYMRAMVTSELPARYLCHPKLLEIIEYDRTHRTNYLNTLTVYIMHGKNAVSAAQELFLSRSTMMYRLKRIREISGIDLDNPDEHLYVIISLRLLKPSRS